MDSLYFLLFRQGSLSLIGSYQVLAQMSYSMNSSGYSSSTSPCGDGIELDEVKVCGGTSYTPGAGGNWVCSTTTDCETGKILNETDYKFVYDDPWGGGGGGGDDGLTICSRTVEHQVEDLSGNAGTWTCIQTYYCKSGIQLNQDCWFEKNPFNPQDIINQLQTPCLNKVLTLLQNNQLKAQVTEILNKVFGAKSDQIRVTFREDPTIPLVTDGLVNGPLSIVNYVGTTVYADIVIDLNSTALKNATQEYVAVTILHEVLHGYLSVRNTQLKAQGRDVAVINDHHVMTAAYVEELKNAILELFPNYPPKYAEAIAWGGLEKTPAYAANSKLPYWEHDIVKKNQEEKNLSGTEPSVGTICK